MVGYAAFMASGVSREQWRKTSLAAMANYIDAGSIVAGAVSLPLWAKQFGFGDDFVSLLGAMSSNAASAGIGAPPETYCPTLTWRMPRTPEKGARVSLHYEADDVVLIKP